MKKWEYKVTNIRDEDACNRMGLKGWEIIAVGEFGIQWKRELVEKPELGPGTLKVRESVTYIPPRWEELYDGDCVTINGKDFILHEPEEGVPPVEKKERGECKRPSIIRVRYRTDSREWVPPQELCWPCFQELASKGKVRGAEFIGQLDSDSLYYCTSVRLDKEPKP